jgi:hypothetical protein
MSDMKQIPCGGPTNIREHHAKLSCPGNLAAGVCAPWGSLCFTHRRNKLFATPWCSSSVICGVMFQILICETWSVCVIPVNILASCVLRNEKYTSTDRGNVVTVELPLIFCRVCWLIILWKYTEILSHSVNCSRQVLDVGTHSVLS